jgi:SAM-dependent methyltransferase
VDLIVSALMLAHVGDPEAELQEWTRLLAAGGEIILTDFHPEAVRSGMKTTFEHEGRVVEVENHFHSVDRLRAQFAALGLEIVAFRERALDERVRSVYERRNRLDLYRRGFGTRLVIGFRLRKT